VLCTRNISASSSVLGMGENRGEGFAGVNSKPEPFLYEPQKKFGTHAGFNRACRKCWGRAGGLATRLCH
jgi:hypothetical protein